MRGFVDRWRREGYAGNIRLVRDGQLPFQTADSLHRPMLEHAALETRGTAAEDKVADLNRSSIGWSPGPTRPWPGAPAGAVRDCDALQRQR